MDCLAKEVTPGLGRTVLLVDDDGVQRKIAQFQLELAGFVVTPVESARRALEIVRELRPDAVVCDVLMDDMDGFSLCEELRRVPELVETPVVLVSAYFDEKADGALARSVGASALVERSPTMQACVGALVEGLARGAAPRTLTPPEPLHAKRLAHRLFQMHEESVRVQAQFRALFENANDAVSIVTPEGVVTDVNRRWEQITGRPRKELVGLRVEDFSPPGSGAEGLARCRGAACTDSDRHGPVPIRRADGSTMLMEFSTATVELVGMRRVLAIGRDVTDVVESRRRLEESERRYRSLVENIPEVFWSCTVPDMKILFVSGNVQRLCGYSVERIHATPIETLVGRVHPDDLPGFETAMEETMTVGTPMDREYRWLHPDGKYRWFHVRAVLAPGADGAPCMEGVFSDVTAKKSLEEQLIRAQKIEAVAQLTAGISHDFNNILSVVLAGAEFLAEMLPPGEGRDVALEICQSAHRGAELNSRLLGFARRREDETREMNLDGVLEGLRPMLARAVGSKVSVNTLGSPGLGMIRADRGELEQVLMNLAVNARDAMPKGGVFTLSTSNVEVVPGADKDAVPPPGRYVVLSVRDTGTGMSEETLARLFEPFFTTKQEKGTGLGLSTSYGIVRKHGGYVRVESAVGKGTVFTIYFPCVGQARAHAAEAANGGVRTVELCA
ncbi:MAG TPA: PAS domain S-box protein [Polyangiaceae bacterium]|nr:PAS domain S-box protein [Polyangiaceae bacterium]